MKGYIKYAPKSWHRAEHWSCYLVPFLGWLLGSVGHRLRIAGMRLEMWHLIHAHGAPPIQSAPPRDTSP